MSENTEQQNINIVLNLSLQEVNGLLAVLAKAPYEMSAGLIAKIREQAIPQVPVEEPKAEESKVEESAE